MRECTRTMRACWGQRVAAVAVLAGCATLFPPTADELRHSAEKFDRGLQWDLRGASQILAPVARQLFLADIARRDDEKNLKVSDVELEDLVIAKDGKSATVTTKLTWYRMPDVSA